MQYIVELRDNRPGSTEADEPSAYLGAREVEDGHPDGPTVAVTAISKREAATRYHNEHEARNDLRNLSDAFFDRYWPSVVGVE